MTSEERNFHLAHCVKQSEKCDVTRFKVIWYTEIQTSPEETNLSDTYKYSRHRWLAEKSSQFQIHAVNEN